MAWRKDRAKQLAIEFERVRAAVGLPLKVLSAYRTEPWNKKVGGAKNSQHIQGRALDLRPPKGWTVDRLYKVIREIAHLPESQIRGLGKYPTFVHMDIRPGDKLTVWQGKRAWAEVK